MDTPEQPTIWPPAPTLAPPEAEKTRPFRLRLRSPEWAAYWLRYGVWFLAAWYITRGFYEVDKLPCPRWCSFPIACGAWFVVGGLLTAWKFWPRKKEE